MPPAERFVTLANRIDDDSKGDQIVNFLEAEPELLHLGVNRVEVFRTSGDLGLHAAFDETARENLDHARDIVLALLPLLGDESLERPVRARIQVAKRQLSSFRFNPIVTSTSSNWRSSL